jgi:hypothetical protein
MYRVYCYIDRNRKYRYYWTKSGCWTMWSKHATPLTLEQAIERINSEEPDSVYYERFT